jgi:hypothetical protein
MNNNKFGKAFGATLLAGGLLGSQVQAAIPTRVAAVRAEMAKRIAEAQQLAGTEAIQKLPSTKMELASWLNWVNWPNWNNWRDWNNWHNWPNWSNWINF